MAGAANYKCRFFKADIDPAGRVAAYMVAGQPNFRANGQEISWDTSLPIVWSDHQAGQNMKAGEVFGAANIEFSPTQKFYVVKGNVYKVVDEDGILITDGDGNAEYEAAIALWDAFSSANGTTTAKAAPVQRGMTELEKVKKDPRFRPPSIDNDGFWVPDELWYDLVMCARNQVSVLLLGPKGTGKTELIDLVANKIGFGYDCFDMSIQNPYAYLCGNTRLNAEGETEFQYARFAQLIQTPDPMVLCLDELSRCAPTAANILLPVLDRRRTLFIENAIDEKGRVLSVGEKVVFWATANMGSEYLGVAGLDEALFDRFVVMETSYPTKAAEAKLLQKRRNLDSKTANLLAYFAEKVRNHADLATKISTRKLLEVGKWVDWGHTPTKAIEKVALSIWPGDESDGGERMTVKSIMQMLN